MVKSFHVSNDSNASFYAGILISAFALSEALTGIFWGGVSDKWGRKPVLLLGCVGTLVSLLIVGFARNFWVALAGRIVGGVLNGNIGVIQTMVGELVKKPEHEPKAYAVMPFVWSIGTIIGPALGGTFANPAKTFPSVFSRDGLFGTFPYLLPNLLCALLLMISITLGYFFLYETHPDLQPTGGNSDHNSSSSVTTPLVAHAGAIDDSGADLRTDSYGTFNQIEFRHNEHWTLDTDGSSRPHSLSDKTRATFLTWPIFMLVVALGIYTYHSMTYDHLLPIFLQDDRLDDISIMQESFFHLSGGLGLSTQRVGLIMSVNGIIALFIQAVIFPALANWLGVWRVFVMVTVLHPIAYFIVPYLALLPPSLLYPGLYTCLTIRNFFNILAYPVLLILLKQASPSPSMLGKINGLAASVGAACRTISPPVSGLLYGLGTQIGFSGLAWWGSAAVALVGGLQLYFIPLEKDDAATIRAAAPCVADLSNADAKSEIIHILVTELHQEEV